MDTAEQGKQQDSYFFLFFPFFAGKTGSREVSYGKLHWELVGLWRRGSDTSYGGFKAKDVPWPTGSGEVGNRGPKSLL